MAVRIIEGVPGAGKSFYAVQHILNTYYRWDEKTDDFVLKKEWREEGLTVITNIDGFKHGVALSELVEAAGGLDRFFLYDYQASMFAGKRVVYLIDEAQGVFPFTYRNTDVMLFFQKHRHLGMDVYLLTQDADLMCKGLRALAEYHIRAVRRSLQVAGEMRFQFVDPNTKEVWRTKVLKRDYRVFAFYRSMDQFEVEKHSSVPLRFAAIAICLCLTAVGVFYFGMKRYITPKSAIASTVPADSGSPARVLSAKEANKQKGEQPTVFGAMKEAVTGKTTYAVVAGRSQIGEKITFIVSVNGRSARYSPDELIRYCGCHVETLEAGSSFEWKGPELGSSGVPGPLANTRSAGAPDSFGRALPGGAVSSVKARRMASNAR